jgi:CubicO group peptidase (beta-lactamase class C family)
VTIDIEGHSEAGYHAVEAAFERAFEDRPTMGAGLSIWRDGREIVSLWGGVADERDGRPWLATTPSVIFSCTKGLMSLVVAMLVERGQLDYDAPVAHYWPEFAQAGKGDITLAEALAHRAGLSAPPVGSDWSFEDMIDWNAATRKLAEQAPLWPRSAYAYHALTHGWLAGEVVRRVTGLSAGRAFATMVAEPLKASAWIGLEDPAAHGVAHLQVAPELDALWRADGEADSPQSPNWGYRAMTLGNAMRGALVRGEEGFNERRLQEAEVPGAGGIASASALASIWSAAVTDTNRYRLITDETIGRATQTQTEGPPVFAVPPPYSRWGMGFQLDSEARRYLGPASFGHDGAGGQVGFADARAGIGFAFVTNWMEAGEDRRATGIIDALRVAVRG